MSDKYEIYSRERLIEEIEDLESTKQTAEYFKKKREMLEKADVLLNEAIEQKDSAMVTATAELIRLLKTIDF